MNERRHSVISRSGEYEKGVRLFTPNGSVETLAVFLDAELYLDRMGAAEVLPTGNIAYAFVQSRSALDRHLDYTCNERFAAFISEDVLPWAAGELGLSAGGHLIAGLSLSGLAAAHLSLLYPDQFARALAQSGSFWWNGEWFAANVPRLTRKPGRFWLSVGDAETSAGVSHEPTGMRQDVDQITGVTGAARALREEGHEVRLKTFRGGHELASWKAELAEAVRWLLA